jgi:radical SAM superfamily enzyme YgiQ (UPF0313 family)
MLEKRILLIKPPSGPELAFPLGLASLVPGLRGAGWEVSGCDADLGMLPAALRRHAAGEFSAVGISVLSAQDADAASIIRRLKALQPSVPVVIGGPHPTLFPQEALLQTGADVAVLGDGEGSFPRTLAAIARKRALPPGTARRRGKSVVVNGLPVFDVDPDGWEAPDRDFLPVLKYGHAYRSVAYPFAPMTAGRGCREACPFCARPALRPAGQVHRSHDSVIGEMKRLKGVYGIKDVHFEDDAFMSLPEWVEGLCDRLAREKSAPVWELVNGVRPWLLDIKLLPSMKRAGCVRIAMGIELVHDDGAKAPHPLSQPFGMIRHIVNAVRSGGIFTTGYFMIGLPGSDRRSDLASISLSRQLGLDHAHYSVFRPVPGSRYHMEGMEEGEPVVLEETARAAARSFYLNAGGMVSAACEVVRSPRVLPGLAARAALELAGLDARVR